MEKNKHEDRIGGETRVSAPIGDREATGSLPPPRTPRMFGKFREYGQTTLSSSMGVHGTAKDEPERVTAD